MDRLIEFLTTKVGYVLTVILGFIVPGNVLIFVWNRNMYLEIDFIIFYFICRIDSQFDSCYCYEFY